jgi:DNA cross-link repair 1A protein
VTTAIRAETFNPATLFLLGTPAVGAERLVLDVAHAQRALLYVSKAKRKVRGKRNSSSQRSG